MNLNPMILRDFYKLSHARFFPKGTTRIYSNFCARGTRTHLNKTIFFGLQYFIKKYLIEDFQKNFFDADIDKLVEDYKRWTGTWVQEDLDGMIALHKLGYLPIRIKALPEGSSVPIRVPSLSIVNTHDDFYWLTNALETLLSCELWHISTSATTAQEYFRVFSKYAAETCDTDDLVPFQGHSFQFRGGQTLGGAMSAGMAHLTSFVGTDDVPAIPMLEHYYNASGLIGCSVPASEHACMCAGTKEGEFDTFKDIIINKFPKGIVSIVSDSWDFWQVVTDYLPRLKEEILAREGKTVIRPDSGDPIKIICGDQDSNIPHVKKGLIECLWDIFGGTINKKGFKELDSHIGAIYGDSITLERQETILNKLKEKGFASNNIVLGIGSYTYTYVTRDTYQHAIKATMATVNGKDIPIFKNPKTDDGTKKSAKGLLRVNGTNGNYTLEENVTWDREGGALEEVFVDGKLTRDTTLEQVRARVKQSL